MTGPMAEQFWKQPVGGRMQYSRAVVPPGQEQPLPYGAVKLTRAAYEAEIAEQPVDNTEPPATAEPEVVTLAAARSDTDVDEARRELAALGLSPATVETILSGVARA